MANKIEIRNKKASHDYEFIDKYTAGIVLKGTEVKSLRMGKASMVDTFCFFRNSELWIRNMHISEYANRGYMNHDPMQERKLLLNASELKKLERKVKEKGLTIVATKLFFSDRGYAKVNIALAKGKKEYDKREDIKKRDTKLQDARLRKL
ncbi:MAG: SsrA-binding protein SmpB [Bacteroidales bacterium]|nr:SsrA-binding protein SmpB [Bacteroidales bacterium]MBN2818855.1 SsrA-binding protein SmpB [Bacteroidales bacterium]